MRIIAYTYDAGMHCVACTDHRGCVGLLTREPPLQLGTDEHGIPLDLIDTEGNAVHPVFDIDETSDTGDTCDTCLGVIREPYRGETA